MDVDTRLKINALVERITSLQEKFFSAADARELIALLPVSEEVNFNIKAIWDKGSGDSSEGYSPGIGNVSLDGQESEKKSWALHDDDEEEIRAGSYKITHTPGNIEISELWADTYEDETGRKCILEYDQDTKQPKALRAAEEKGVDLWFLKFSVVTYPVWKEPKESDEPEVL